jgi:hypothetical protein
MLQHVIVSLSQFGTQVHQKGQPQGDVQSGPPLLPLTVAPNRNRILIGGKTGLISVASRLFGFGAHWFLKLTHYRVYRLTAMRLAVPSTMSNLVSNVSHFVFCM